MKNKLNQFFSRTITALKGYVEVKSRDKDLTRRGFILNTLLLCSLSLSSIAAFVVLLHTIFSQASYSKPIEAFSYCVIFLILYIISRTGHHRTAAFIFIAFYYLLITLAAVKWGAGFPQGILVYAFIIVMSGILINSAFSFVATTIISITLMALIYMQSNQLMLISHIDNNEIIKLNFGDSVVFSITYYVLATVSWLFNRESEGALKRARTSERELQIERDSLAVKVEEKTRKLQQEQSEKITQLYKFAEFGKFASGFLHDLSNSVNLVSANLRQLENNKNNVNEMKEILARAKIGTHRLETFIAVTRKQVNNQEFSKLFSVPDEITQAIEILNYKAKKANVSINYGPSQRIQTYGNPLKFHQLISNLISNAIDSYDGTNKKKKIVTIILLEESKTIQIQVIDFGKGILKKNINSIFEPFFTTKGFEKGTGIGLSITHDIIIKDFQGNVQVQSAPGLGSTFTVTFPQRNKI